MNLPTLARDDISAQDGLELLKAFVGIGDPCVRAKVLAWVIDVQAGATGLPPVTSPGRVLADAHDDGRLG